MYCADCTESVDLVITSPQRDYSGGIGNEKSIDEYIENIMIVFRECVRVFPLSSYLKSTTSFFRFVKKDSLSCFGLVTASPLGATALYHIR
jgi:hypothetical protein